MNQIISALKQECGDVLAEGFEHDAEQICSRHVGKYEPHIRAPRMIITCRRWDETKLLRGWSGEVSQDSEEGNKSKRNPVVK